MRRLSEPFPHCGKRADLQDQRILLLLEMWTGSLKPTGSVATRPQTGVSTPAGGSSGAEKQP